MTVALCLLAMSCPLPDQPLAPVPAFPPPAPLTARGGEAEAYAPPRGGAASEPSNVEIGFDMAAQRGWGPSERECLYQVFNHESGWDETAWNRQSGASDPADDPSGAYGIPQSHPPAKLAAAGADWRTNPRTQLRWALRYIAIRYGTPCAAWAQWRNYAGGGSNYSY